MSQDLVKANSVGMTFQRSLNQQRTDFALSFSLMILKTTRGFLFRINPSVLQPNKLVSIAVFSMFFLNKIQLSFVGKQNMYPNL